MMLFRILATLVALLFVNGALAVTTTAIAHQLADLDQNYIEHDGMFVKLPMDISDTSPPTMVLPTTFTTTESFSTEITLSPVTTTTEPIGQQSAVVDVAEVKIPMSLRSTHPPTMPTTFKIKSSFSTVVTLSPVTTTTEPIGQQPPSSTEHKVLDVKDAMSLRSTHPPTMPTTFKTKGSSVSTVVTLSPVTTTTEPIGPQPVSTQHEVLEVKDAMSLRSTHPPTMPTTFKTKGSVSTVVTLLPVTTTTAPIGQQPPTASG